MCMYAIQQLASQEINSALLVLAAVLTSGLGSLGGLGGAILLVPILVMAGVPASQAAPLGLLTVVGASVVATSRQLGEKVVNHRVGVMTELAATSGAVIGALFAGSLSDSLITRVLAAVALVAAFASGRRKGLRWKPDPSYGQESVGEWVGTLSGAYLLDGQVVPYHPRRVALGVAAMSIAGLITGIAGVGGGFIKSPVTSEIMHVPVRVAVATTTFTIGITASAALFVFIGQGTLDVSNGALVVLGAMIGGRIGAQVQGRLAPPTVRRYLSALLVVIAVVLLVRG